MSYSEKYFFDKDDELLKFLIDKADRNRKTIIIGGHYMLFYDKSSDSLKPLIKEDLSLESHKQFAYLHTSGFPEKSMDIAITLHKSLNSMNVFNKFAFIVNDHKFQSKNFQSNISDKIAGRTAELRKKYYANNSIPDYYKRIFDVNGIDYSDTVQKYIIKDIKKEDNLQEEVYFYSEQRLRNKFDRNLKEKLTYDGKIKKMVSGTGFELYYCGFNNSDICLTEDGGCGCSGEVMEFINELYLLGYSNFYFFVPDECQVAVNNGFGIINEIIHNNLNIYSISGFANTQYVVTKISDS